MVLVKSFYRDLPPVPDTNFHHVLFNRDDQKAWPDFIVHIDAQTGEKRMHREFVERMYDAATALGAPVAEGGLGLKSDGSERIGIVADNSSDYIALIHASLVLAIPFIPISSYSTPFELKYALELTKPTRLFVHAKYLPTVLPTAKEAGIAEHNIYILGGQAGGRGSFADMIDHVRKNRIPRVPVRPAKKETLAYLIFSSGTSGLPKAVMISHGNLIAVVLQSKVAQEEAMPAFPPKGPALPEGILIALAFMPLHHSYGLHYFGFGPFLAPMTMVLMDRWNADRALELVPKYRISCLPLVPSVVHQLVNHPGMKTADLSSVIDVNSGAAYLPPELAAKLTALTTNKVPVREGFGMSECTIGAIAQPAPGSLSGRGKLLPGSTGLLLPGLEARIVRDDGTEAEYNEPGEMWLRGPMVAGGYWNNPEATKATFLKDGWLRTGDTFRVTEEGYFFFSDRTKDTLKISGSQVSPVEIETVLLAHPDSLIIDVSVAGVSGGRTADEKVPRAWIVLSPAGQKRGEAEVIKILDTWHKEKLSKYKWLRGGFEVVPEIPKSPTGKVLRRVLRDSYEKRAGGPAKSKL